VITLTVGILAVVLWLTLFLPWQLSNPFSIGQWWQPSSPPLVDAEIRPLVVARPAVTPTTPSLGPSTGHLPASEDVVRSTVELTETLVPDPMSSSPNP